MRLTWYGHACWLLDAPGAAILIDPFLTGNPVAPVAAADVRADYVLVTHGHGDHFCDAVAIAKRTGATIVANHEIATACAEEGCAAHGMHIGGAHAFPFGRVKLTIAHHGSSFPDGRQAGNPCGFLITLGKTKLYHAGDTGLFLDMKLIGEERLAAAMIPIGDNYTMGPDDALRAARLLRPRVLLPMHYDTFDLIRQDAAAFARRVRRALPKTRVVVLQPGEAWEVPG